MDLNSKERLPKEAEDLLLQCSTAREEKNYGEAIYFVNAALECSQKAATAPHLLVGVHDIRHAVCGRAGNLDEALKSAKAMIRLDRSDARGYLRCGRLERDRGNKTAALRYYEHGVKNCPNSIFLNILRELADDMRDELSAELVLSRARDPMTSLPLEIMDMVLSHLNYRQVVRMLRVSKSWRRLLSDRPPLSDTIAFPSDTAVPITPYMALVTLDRLKTTPRVLKLASLTPAARIMLQNRFVATPILESLKIFMLSDRGFDTHNLSFSSVNLRKLALPHPTRCRRAVVDRILLQCSSLEVASFSVEENIFDEPDWSFSSDSLIELDVGCDDDRTSLQSLALFMPRLQSLTLRSMKHVSRGTLGDLDLRHLQNLATLSLYNCGVADLFLPPSITHLCMESCRYDTTMIRRIPRPESDFPALPCLKSLSILPSEPPYREVPKYPPFICAAAAKTKPGKLTRLALSQIPDNPTDLTALLQSGWFAGLTALLVEGQLGDQHAPLFIAHCPDLKRVHVRGAAITGVFVADLMRAPASKLRAVKLEDCTKVSKDTVPWAAERGVLVEYVSSVDAEGNGNGRRVRELE